MDKQHTWRPALSMLSDWRIICFLVLGVCREDYILLSTLLMAVVNYSVPAFGGRTYPLWSNEGLLIMFLLHMGPTEAVYYWAHRALHHHYLYNRYHSHHHSLFITEANSGKWVCTQSMWKKRHMIWNRLFIRDITLFNDVGPRNIALGCWKLTLNPSLLAQLFEHPSVIFWGSTEWELNVE